MKIDLFDLGMINHPSWTMNSWHLMEGHSMMERDRNKAGDSAAASGQEEKNGPLGSGAAGCVN